MMLALLLAAAAPDCAKAITQFDLTACAGLEYEQADAALNAQWKKTLAAMRARDADYKAYSAADRSVSFVDALRAAQRAWIAFRDAQCQLESYEMRGGTGAPMIEYGCRASMTEARTAQLKDIAESH